MGVHNLLGLGFSVLRLLAILLPKVQPTSNPIDYSNLPSLIHILLHKLGLMRTQIEIPLSIQLTLQVPYLALRSSWLRLSVKPKVGRFKFFSVITI